MDSSTNERHYPSGRDRALELIAKAKATRAESLDLGQLGLAELPEQIRELPWLRELNLSWSYRSFSTGMLNHAVDYFSDNLLQSLPPWLGELTELEALHLGYVRDLESLAPLRQLPNLRHLSIGVCDGTVSLEVLANLPGLESLKLYARELAGFLPLLSRLENLVQLDLGNCSGLPSLDSLAGMPKLRVLLLGNCDVEDASALRHLTSLEVLDLSGCEGLTDVNFLRHLTNLEALNLAKCPALEEISPLAGLHNLRELNLSGCPLGGAIDSLAGLYALESLDISHCETIANGDALGNLAALRELNIASCASLESIEFLSRLVGLESLACGAIPALADARVLRGMRRLRTLNLSCSPNLQDVTGLAGAIALEKLDLRNCPALLNVDGLGGLAALQSIDLRDCYSLENIDSLAGLERLQELLLGGCEALRGVRGLNRLPMLRTLDLSGCEALRSFDGVGELPELEILEARACSGLRRIEGLAAFTALRHINLSNCISLTSIAGLGALKRLHTLSLMGCAALQSVNELASATSLQQLDLRHCRALREVDLGHLPNLRTLTLHRCERLQNVDGLAGLSALTSVTLSSCTGLRDVDGLAGLPKLESIELVGCKGLTRLPGFVLNAPALTTLLLADSGIRDVPAALFGVYSGDNCLPGIRAHFADLGRAETVDREVKLIVLGNGRVGKTSLCRRLVEGAFDPAEVSTHGVKFWTWALHGEADPDMRIDVNVWDFGGQDIYLGTHAMFLRGRAVFLIAWDEVTEALREFVDPETGFAHRNYPLQYWLDYVNHVSPGSPVIVVQTKCSGAEMHRPRRGDLRLRRNPVAECWFQASEPDAAANNRDALLAALESAAEQTLGWREAQRIGVGRWRVKKELRAMVEAGTPKTLTVEDFEELCARHQLEGADAAAHLLAYLHNAGLVYHRRDLFNEAIVLDQRWACDAIYTVLNRTNCVARIRAQDGQFTASDLAAWSWADRSTQERELFLRMMLTCGICVRLQHNRGNEPLYLAPELAPDREAMEERFPWPAGEATQWWRYELDFLGPAIMRHAIAEATEDRSEKIVIWRDGFHLSARKPAGQALVQAEYQCDGDPSRGRITMQVRGPQGAELLQRMRELFEGPRRRWVLRDYDRAAFAMFYSRDGDHFVRIVDPLEKI